MVKRQNKRWLFVLILVLASARIYAQDVTGIWRGHFRSNEIYQRLTGEDDRYKMEVQIAQDKKSFKAVTYSYKSTVFYGKAEAVGTVDTKAQKVLLKEMKIVEVRMMAGDACTMTCYLRYSRLGDEEFLEGTYTSMNTRDSSDCGRGSIFLHKVFNSDFHKEPFLEKKEEDLANARKKAASDSALKKKMSPTVASAPVVAAKKPAPKPTSTAPVTKTATVAKSKTRQTPMAKTPEKTLAKKNLDQHPVAPVEKDSIKPMEHKSIPIPVPLELSSRSNELVRTLTVNSQDVQLFIYDDGVVDNDTVSVYFDNRRIIQNARLTTEPLIARIHLDESSPSHEVVMVAENLGEIPPNTSLMVVKAGDQRFEVRIVSTEQKNAVIVFKYQKPQ